MRLIALSTLVTVLFACSKKDADQAIVTPLNINSFTVNGEEKQNESSVRMAVGQIASIAVKVSTDAGSPAYRWALSPQNIVLPETGAELIWKVPSPGDYTIGVQASNETGGSDLKKVQIKSVAADFMNSLWSSNMEEAQAVETFYNSVLIDASETSLLYQLTRTDRDNGINGDSVSNNEQIVYQFTDGKLDRGIKIITREYESKNIESIFDDYGRDKTNLSIYTPGEETESWSSNTFKAIYNGSPEDRAKAIERGYLTLIANFSSATSSVQLIVEGEGKGKPVSFSRRYAPL